MTVCRSIVPPNIRTTLSIRCPASNADRKRASSPRYVSNHWSRILRFAASGTWFPERSSCKDDMPYPFSDADALSGMSCMLCVCVPSSVSIPAEDSTPTNSSNCPGTVFLSAGITSISVISLYRLSAIRSSCPLTVSDAENVLSAMPDRMERVKIVSSLSCFVPLSHDTSACSLSSLSINDDTVSASSSETLPESHVNAGVPVNREANSLRCPLSGRPFIQCSRDSGFSLASRSRRSLFAEWGMFASSSHVLNGTLRSMRAASGSAETPETAPSSTALCCSVPCCAGSISDSRRSM